MAELRGGGVLTKRLVVRWKNYYSVNIIKTRLHKTMASPPVEGTVRRCRQGGPDRNDGWWAAMVWVVQLKNGKDKKESG